MDTQSIFEFFNKLKDDSLSFLYHGFMSDEFTDKIISLSERNIEKISDLKSIKRKVAFLIAESFQNIIRHGETLNREDTGYTKSGIFVFRILEDSYVISSVNLMNNNNIENVEKKLLQINSLDKEQLKALYQEAMENTGLSEKGGAGLGLIEMARKTGNKLEYEFEKVNEKYSNFYLQMKLDPTSTIDDNTLKHSISSIKEFYSIMDQNNTYLTYKGDFTQENVLILLKIIERNLQINKFEHESIKSLIYIILTELLQNISKHAFSVASNKEGIFQIGKYINKYVLSTGNFIENINIRAFKDNLHFLNNMNKEELNKLYFDKIKNGDIDDFGNASLGFVEIAKECDGINYNITEINDFYSFLTISINL